MGAQRCLVGWLAAIVVTGCGPQGIAAAGPVAIAQIGRRLSDTWTGRPLPPTTSAASRFGLPDATTFRQPDAVENYRAALIQAIDQGHRRSRDEIYQVQTMQWSQKYDRTIYFTAIGYSPRMEPRWQMYGHYFLSGATANNPGAVIMQNSPLE